MMHASIPDAQLLDRWRTRRDADAFAELVSRYGPLVFSACLRVLRCRAAAEDAAQDCFVELFQSRARARSLPCYLHVTATHRALDRLKAEKRRGEWEARFASAHAETVPPDWDDLSTLIDEAIAHLPEKLRQPVILRFLQGRTYAEIASEADLPVSTIQYRLNQGIEGIRGHLAKRGLMVGASSLATLLAAAPSHALPAAAAAKLGTLALAGGATAMLSSVSSVSVGLTLGGMLVMKQTIALLAVVVAASLSTWYVLDSEDPVGTETDAHSPVVASPSIDIGVKQPVQEMRPLAALVSNEVATITSPPQIRGVVLNPEGEPAPDALVEGDWGGGNVSVKSDQSGRFSIALPTDFAPDPPSTTKRFWIRATKDDSKSFADHFNVSDSGMDGVTLTLERTGSISGRVVDAGGNPLPEWSVEAHNKATGDSTTTNDMGEFHFSHLRANDYELSAQDERGRSAFYDGIISLRAGAVIADVTLHFVESDTRIAGYVTSVEGHPVESADLWLSYQSDMGPRGKYQSLNGKSDATGRYEIFGFTNPVSSLVSLQVNHPDYVDESRFSIPLDGHEEDFVLPKRPVISGLVLDTSTGEPVSRFRLHHWMTNPATPPWVNELHETNANRQTITESSNGSFTIRLDGYNTIKLSVAAPGYVTTTRDFPDVEPGAVVDGVEIRLNPAESRNGLVVDPSGAPVAGARIYIGYPAHEHSTGEKGITTSDENGAFSLTEFPTSLSLISASHKDYAPAWAEVKASAPIRITLSKGAVVEGIITIDGRPIEDGLAELYLDDQRMPTAMSQVRADGRYSMRNVPPGPVSLFAGYNLESLRQYKRREIQVRPGESIRHDVDFDSTADSYIQGVLSLDGQATGVALIRATANPEDGDEALYQTESRADGSFTLGPIPAGSYEFGPIFIQMKDGSYIEPEAEAVSVEDGETLEHDLTYTSR